MIFEGLVKLRPADALNISFLLFLSALTAYSYSKLSNPSFLILLYSGLIIIQILLIALKDRNRALRFIYDLIFPTISILAIFDSLELVVHYINPVDIDPLLIKIDHFIFNGHPTVMLETLASPLLTDFLQLAYSSYYFIPISYGIVLLTKKKEKEFDYSVFIIMLCFYLSYAGYMLTPALGPRFAMSHLQNTELQGLLITAPLQELLNRLEGIKRDAFPSGHTAIAVTVVYLSWRFEKKLFYIYLPVVAALIFSTVYLRYHYVVDVLAGFLLFAITFFAGDKYYGYREKRINPDC